MQSIRISSGEIMNFPVCGFVTEPYRNRTVGYHSHEVEYTLS